MYGDEIDTHYYEIHDDSIVCSICKSWYRQSEKHECYQDLRNKKIESLTEQVKNLNIALQSLQSDFENLKLVFSAFLKEYRRAKNESRTRK